MNILWAALITAAAVAFAVAAMLFVRRRAPEGSYFADGDRAAGFFGVLATGFAILLGFVVFLAFESFDQSRSGAETEALLVLQQFETAQFFPPDARARLSGELVCYARSVVQQEWPEMEVGKGQDTVNSWGVALFRTLQSVNPQTAAAQSAYDKWRDQTSDREQARLDRLHGAEGVIPVTLWIVLFVIAAIIFAYMLFFADSGEGAVTQGMMIGSAVAVMVMTLLVLKVLDTPFHRGVGGLRPVAMTRTLDLIGQASAAIGLTTRPPCDESGIAA
jgi:amino acid transporter